MRTCLLLTSLLVMCNIAFAQDEAVVTTLDAWADLDNAVHVRWITAQGDPAKCEVHYGPAGGESRVVDEDPSCLRGTTNNSDAGTGWANNHRADIPGNETWPLQIRVTGKTRAGVEFESGTVTVQDPKQPATRPGKTSIPITVAPGEWKLETLPITVGVPFPRGELGSSDYVRVMIGGEEVPSQMKVVTRWREDNSIKWLRVCFIAPNDAPDVSLEYGTSVGRRAYATDSVDSIVITGELLDARLTGSDGRAYTRVLETSTVEDEGPVKVTSRYDGHFVAEDGSRLCAFSIRSHVWANGLVNTLYTFENDNTDAEFTEIRSLVISATGTQHEQLSVGRGDDRADLADGETVLQREDFEWVKQPGDVKGRRLDGVVACSHDELIVVRDFWRQWPISLGLSGGRLSIGLLPALPEGFYADRKDEDKLYYQLRDGVHSLRQGFSRTWEIWFGMVETPDRPGMESVIGEKPVASVPAQWIEDSGALLKLAVASNDQFAGYDETLAASIGNYQSVCDSRREYGMMNFGDWYGERTWNWGNLEYDLGHAFLTQFARTQDTRFFWRAEEALRHQRDVDTRHHANDPRRVGQQWTHCMGHTAGYYPPEYKDMKVYASPGWSDNRGHVWSQGMFEHYLLGGDERSWQTAKLISDNYGGPGMTNYRFGNAREPGWVTKMQMGAYLATEDTFYLNAAKIMLDAVHEQSLATGDHGFYYHKLPNGHCDCPDDQKHYGEAGFMLGVLMTGMRMYYDVTGDERVAEDIVKTARFIADTMWDPETLGFRYTSCPETGASAASSWIMMHGLAFAAKYADDAELSEVCRKSLAAGWRHLPTSGKSAGYILCASAPALQEVAQLPGVSFAEYRDEIERALSSPARRYLPTNMPNPDFETNIDGWPSRGITIEQTTDVKHSGRACMKISGKMVRQNEYVNTRYEAAGDPYEVVWLKPGQTYRLSAWLRIDRISEGTPAPSMRLATRDATGTRGSASTNAYDLSKLGTWQNLTVDAQIPEWNTRNYIALNTNAREEVDVEMYFDDISLVPVDQASAEWYSYLRMDPEAARLEAGAQVKSDATIPGKVRVAGPGSAEWNVDVEAAGTYSLWAVLDAGTTLEGVAINGVALAPAEAPDEPTWVKLGQVDLKPGQARVRINIPGGKGVGRMVLTNDPSSSV